MPFRDPEKRRAYLRAWRLANLERAAEASRAWRNRHPERVREGGARYYANNRHTIRLRRLNLTPDQYDQILAAQSGRCAICQKKMRRPAIDHDHKTGAVRGLLCPGCNIGLGYFGDSAPGLRRALIYLEGLLPLDRTSHIPVSDQGCEDVQFGECRGNQQPTASAPSPF